VSVIVHTFKEHTVEEGFAKSVN